MPFKMTCQTNKNRKWTIAFGVGFLIFYLFLDFLWDKLWVMSIFLLLLLGLTFLVFAIIGLIRKEKYVLSIIAVVALTISGVEVAKSEIFKSPVILNASLKDDLNIIYLRFRENKTFEVNVTTMFDNEEFTGKYNLQGEKLIFLDKHYDNDFIPDTLTIGKDKIYFQFDSSGKPLSNFAAYFTITQNKLKSSL